MEVVARDLKVPPDENFEVEKLTSQSFGKSGERSTFCTEFDLEFKSTFNTTPPTSTKSTAPTRASTSSQARWFDTAAKTVEFKSTALALLALKQLENVTFQDCC